MKEFLPVLRSSLLFSGVSEDELTAMLSCLRAERKDFPKDAFVLRTGDTARSIGLVLSGNVLVIQEDIWGNRNILSKAGPGQTFAAAFACAPGARLNVSVMAETPVTAMFLDVTCILNMCPSTCAHHSRIIRNLLGELAEKNLRFSESLRTWASAAPGQSSCPISPPRPSGWGNTNLISHFPGSSLRIILASSAADCPLSWEKCAAKGLLTFTKVISC